MHTPRYVHATARLRNTAITTAMTSLSSSYRCGSGGLMKGSVEPLPNPARPTSYSHAATTTLTYNPTHTPCNNTCTGSTRTG